jgi:AraC family transcriptional regulator
MPLEIRQLPALRLACMRHTGPYGHPALGQLWERMGQWYQSQAQPGAPWPKFYGLSHDNPACTPPAACRYDAAVEVGADFVPGPEVAIGHLVAGRYACLPFYGTGPEVGAACQRLYLEVLPAAGLTPAPAPLLEIYDEDFAVDPATGAFACWLCAAVQPA